MFYTDLNNLLLSVIKCDIIPIQTTKIIEDSIANMQGVSLRIHSAPIIKIIRDIKVIPKAQNMSILVAFDLDSQYS